MENEKKIFTLFTDTEEWSENDLDFKMYGDIRSIAKGKEHQFENYTREEVISKLGRQWKKNLINLKIFASMIGFDIPDEYQIEKPISSTSKRFVRKFGTHDTVSKIIKKAILIDMLHCSEKKYRFSTGLKNTYSKKYIINKKMIEKLSSEDYSDINTDKEEKKIFLNENRSNDSISSAISSSISKKQTVFCFSSKIRGRKGGADLSDKEIIEDLCLQYPQLSDIEDIIIENNKYLPEELKQRFNPCIKKTEKGKVSKIGIRATSSICNLKSRENSNKNYKGKWRKDFLREYFGTEDYFSYDIKSSIFRITRLLNKGDWLNDGIDLYSKMAGLEFEDDDHRDVYKTISMKVYFDTSGKNIYNHSLIASLEKSNYTYIKEVLEPSKDVLIKAFDSYKYRMFNVIGRGYDSEIFLHESAICALIHKELLSRGLKVVQVYDGFYYNKDVKDIKEIVRNSAMYYYNTYIVNKTSDMAA